MDKTQSNINYEIIALIIGVTLILISFFVVLASPIEYNGKIQIGSFEVKIPLNNNQSMPFKMHDNTVIEINGKIPIYLFYLLINK